MHRVRQRKVKMQLELVPFTAKKLLFIAITLINVSFSIEVKTVTKG